MLTTIFALLTGTVGKILASIGGVLVAFMAGRKVASQKAKIDTLKAKDATRERIDHAEVTGDDPGAARRWLSERGRK